MREPLVELKTRLQEIFDLRMTGSVLSWDQSTYMPPGGAAARGRQMATVGAIAHQRLVDPAIGKLLETLEPWAAKQPYDSDDAALIRVTRREYDQAIKVPAELISELNRHIAHSYQEWAEARPANDFARVRPLLEKTLELSRRYADCFPGYESIADPLIDYSDYGMKASSVRAVFAELRARLVPLARAIAEQPPIDESVLHRRVPADRQMAFATAMVKRFGYDYERGRQDITLHPFMTKFSLGDVRITARVNEDDFSDGLFSMLHEAGHAMYEQGIRMDLEGTPLANGTSSGVHESQSRLWENLVGRSRGFWQFAFPLLRDAFGDSISGVSEEAFYRAINRVKRSLVRTEADEVTYNLHVMIRFDLELDLLEGRLAIKDLPEAWHARYQQDLGVRAPDDRDGILQDVHWYAGLIGGAFQGYTLGNIMGGQFYAAALKALPTIPDDIARGEFANLHGWMRDHIYQHGSKFTADELLMRVTGGPLSVEPYMTYLWGKYAPLYGLESREAAGARS
ncbi:MAG: carboxypeptidase M32 [Candidatus Eisenbacteria bacterium]|uniref:Metal-dependent carboxypeptidase n=1 Tax=Eiseniibacteriota bacterium TaxID=2212470 RepID=A0A849SK75_UNCEI|nr:carboxypeptidase M32 [Candidatus Eisenbacteria bacterium]